MARSQRAPGSGGSSIVRMKDIAHRGKVSLATVSQVLGGQSAQRYSRATQDKVLRVAREMGWVPNRLVRGIQTGRSGLAGVIMVPSGEHWQRLAIGLQTELLARNLLPLALHPDYDANSGVSELGLLRNLMELRVEGIVCWPLTDPAALDYLASVCCKHVPVVTLDFELPPAANAIEVRTPEHKAMALALDHLTALGHRRIAYAGFATPGDWVADRRTAFLDEMARRVLPVPFVKEIGKGDNHALARLPHELAGQTAVIVATEQLAVSVWHVVENAGRHIPGDLSIVGFGQFHSDFALWPTFTSIDQRPEEIGRIAATLLADPAARVAAEHDRKADTRLLRYVEVEPALVMGQTTAKAVEPRPPRK